MSEIQEEKQSLIPVEIQTKVEKELSEIVSGTSTIVAIDNNVQFENAVALTKTIKAIAAEFEETRDSLVRPKNQEVKEINAWFKIPQTKLETLEKNIKAVLLTYQIACERKRIELQKAADELARKEREKIEKAAQEQRDRETANRLAAEAAQKAAEDALRAAEDARQRAADAVDAESRAIADAEAKAADADRVRADNAAKAAAARAEDAAAKARMQETIAETVVAVQVDAPISKPAGMSKVITYAGEIIDKKAAIEFCLTNNKLHLIELAMATINKMVVAENVNFSMPGIKVVKTESLRMSK